jgi:hypothetical protein
MVPSSALFDQSVLQQLLDIDPLVQDYRAFFACLDWSLVDHWQAERSSRGRPPHPESAYLKAFLLRMREGIIYTSHLRRFLLKHPLLVRELGFQLALDPSAPYGFDCQRTLPSEVRLRQKLRTFDQDLLQALLAATVAALQEAIPGLGETIAFDVKHIFAWVRENNPNVYVHGRFDVTYIPTGDPDCRLGVKKSSNQVQPDGSKQEKKVSLFGYGTGVAASTDPVYGDVVLAEYTLPFNRADVTHFRPLYQRAVVALDQYPTYVTADAAYDYWYVYETVAHRQGIAAIPLNNHGHEEVPHDPDGTPYCSKGLRMHPVFQFQHTNGYTAQRFRCPLLFPERTGQVCEHAQFTKAKGCVKDPNWEKGGLMRVLLDRTSPLYHVIYNQRTACERINSQAQALGIERPKVRNGHSVRNLNTLTYLIVNVRALQKAKSINTGIQHMH